MYSVVLLAAMTAGGQTQANHGCLSCGNCYGSCYGNYGIDSWNCYGGRYAGSCNSSWGGPGWGGYNCGCGWGGYDYSGCGCHGCWGAYSETSPYFVEQPPAVAPTGPVTRPGEPLPPPSKPGEPLPPPSKPGDVKPPEAKAPTRARLIVEVPADAKLTIDETAMKSGSEHRVFQTPELEAGQTYFYDVRVEAQRNGKPVSETKRVLLRAGQEVRADFSDLTATSTAQAK